MSSTKLTPRVNFGKIKHLAETPDLLEVQIQSFKDLFQLETTPDKRNIEGLFKVFKDPLIRGIFSCWNSLITSSIHFAM
jgi:DNA-directed RNA polymerase subunit beta